jgi:hypothetical protein
VFSLFILRYLLHKMNPRELLDHIRSGPANLVLNEPLRFRRRKRSSPCDFNEFLQALQASETIREVICFPHHMLGIAEDEWVLLVKTIGRIKDIQNLEFTCKDGSRDFHPFQAIAEAVNSAHSHHNLRINLEGENFPIDSSGINALANALRKHTALRTFSWIDFCSRMEAAQSSAALDPLLRALSACSHLQKITIMTEFASADAIRNLLQLLTDTDLRLSLTPAHWLAVADDIRQGRCNIKQLALWMVRSSSSGATEAVKVVASAIQEDRYLESLELRMEDAFTDEAGVALAEALTINQTLSILLLDDSFFSRARSHTKASLGAQAYEAFGAMLRVNTSIELDLPDEALDDERDIEHFTQMLIEQRLNELLMSSQTPREEWVDALQGLNALDDEFLFVVSCLYILL